MNRLEDIPIGLHSIKVCGFEQLREVPGNSGHVKWRKLLRMGHCQRLDKTLTHAKHSQSLMSTIDCVERLTISLAIVMPFS